MNQQKVKFNMLKSQETYIGAIFRKEESIKMLNREQVFVAYAAIENSAVNVPINLIVPCTIIIKDLKPIQYIFQILNTFFR
jgi:hypothetical protein